MQAEPTPELRTLLWCLRGFVAQEEGLGPAALPRLDVDWQRFADLASGHGVLPLVTLFLRRREGDLVPAAVLDGLQDRFRSVAVTNLHLTRELLDILALFETNGLPAIPYKGPVLAYSLYGNVALRQFIDLDFLVRWEDVGRAQSLLQAKGYRPLIPVESPNALAFHRYTGELVLEQADKGFVVELRWAHPSSPLPLGVDELAERLVPVVLGGQTLRTLNPSDRLLFLSVHGSKHLWERLGWLCDLAGLAAAEPTLPWGEVAERARSMGAERRFLLGALLAAELLGVPVPTGVLERARSTTAVKALAAEVVRRLVHGPQDQEKTGEKLSSLGLALRLLDRPGDRLRYCLRVATTPNPNDFEFLPLPPRLFPLYRLIHPLRLLLSRGLGAFAGDRRAG